MLQTVGARTFRSAARVAAHWQPPDNSSSNFAGPVRSILALEAGPVVLAGAAWRALQLRFFAKRKRPQGPHVWLKQDGDKWHKDLTLDSVWEKEKEVIYLSALKDILANQPEMKMSLSMLRNYKRYIGLSGSNTTLAAWLQKYPALFEVDEEMPYLEYLPSSACSFFRFTPQAAEYAAKEKQFWLENEKLLVDKMKKILMMAPDRRIRVDIFGHFRKALGLSEDLTTNLVNRYPEYFRLVETPVGHDLELKEWDQGLATSSFERTHMEPQSGSALEQFEGWPEDVVNWSSFEYKGNLWKVHRNEIITFHQAPFVSPYQEAPVHVKDNSIEAEKHAVAVLHELISLTLRKRIDLHRLCKFSTFWHYNKATRSLVIQHPELFYLSLKNGQETVFLREAYQGCELQVIDPFLEVQSWVAVLLEESKAVIKSQKDQARLEREKSKLERLAATSDENSRQD